MVISITCGNPFYIYGHSNGMTMRGLCFCILTTNKMLSTYILSEYMDIQSPPPV